MPPHTAGSQFVSDDALGWHTLFLQQPGQKTLRGFGIAPTLNNLIENIAMLVNRAPQPMFLASDADDHFIQMPDIIPVGLLAVQSTGIVRTKLLAQRRMVSYETTIPRSSSSSSTSRKLNG
jgi:hypothetical protein